MNEIIGNEVNFIPLFSLEDEEKLQKEQVNEVVPILPLMNTVLFPGMVIPITVGRSKSIKLAQEHSRSNQPIGVITHKDNELEEPAKEDLYAVGTMARIIKFLSMPDGSVTIIVQGIKRFELLEIVETEPYYKARVAEYVTKEFTPDLKNNSDFQALVGSIRDTAVSMLRVSPNMPREATYMLQNIESPSFLMDFIASNLSVTVAEKQSILEIRDIEERGKVVLKFLNKDLQMMELKNQIQNKSREEMSKQSREYMLHQQMKTIQEELGGSPAEKDTKQLEERAEAKKWNDETKALFERELKKLQRTNPMSPDYSITLNYLELMVDLPWNEFADENFNLKKGAEILDRDHFGLEKVKERILEYLAVLKLKGDMKSPILYALSCPLRFETDYPRLDFAKYTALTFEKPDLQRFPALDLAFQALKTGGNMPCIMNAANEAAVQAFLNEQICFMDIPRLIEKAMQKITYIANPTINQLLETHSETVFSL